MPLASQYGNVLELFRDIHAHAQRTGEVIESADDSMERRVGFVASGVVRTLWEIPLTKLKPPFMDTGDEGTTEQLRSLFRAPTGRARLAAMLTDGTFPGA